MVMPLVTNDGSHDSLTAPDANGDDCKIGAMIPGQVTTTGSDNRLTYFSTEDNA